VNTTPKAGLGRASALCAVLFLPGCGGTAPDDATPEPQVVRLTDSRVFERDDLRGVMPFGVAARGDQVLVLDVGADSMLAFFDTSGTYLGRSGPAGEARARCAFPLWPGPERTASDIGTPDSGDSAGSPPRPPGDRSPGYGTRWLGVWVGRLAGR